MNNKGLCEGKCEYENYLCIVEWWQNKFIFCRHSYYSIRAISIKIILESYVILNRQLRNKSLFLIPSRVEILLCRISKMKMNHREGDYRQIFKIPGSALWNLQDFYPYQRIGFLFCNDARMGKLFIVERNIPDNVRSVGNDAEFKSIAEMSIDVHLPNGRSASMGRHGSISRFVRGIGIIQPVCLLKVFNCLMIRLAYLGLFQ